MDNNKNEFLLAVAPFSNSWSINAGLCSLIVPRCHRWLTFAFKSLEKFTFSNWSRYVYKNVEVFKHVVSSLSFSSLAKSQHYSDGLIDIFTQYGDHLYRWQICKCLNCWVGICLSDHYWDFGEKRFANKFKKKCNRVIVEIFISGQLW